MWGQSARVLSNIEEFEAACVDSMASALLGSTCKPSQKNPGSYMCDISTDELHELLFCLDCRMQIVLGCDGQRWNHHCQRQAAHRDLLHVHESILMSDIMLAVPNASQQLFRLRLDVCLEQHPALQPVKEC